MSGNREYAYITTDGDQLDAICHRFYGFIDGAVEMVLEANPGLEYRGLTYDKDVRIILPDLEGGASDAGETTLWD